MKPDKNFKMPRSIKRRLSLMADRDLKSAYKHAMIDACLTYDYAAKQAASGKKMEQTEE